MKIIDIKARYILDSRGWPTVESDVILENGVFGRASVPSGASTGSREAIELRDGDKDHYSGNGVLKAINNIHNKILPKIKGLEVRNQNLIDDVMIDIDGTKNKSNLGANAILSVSIAAAKACANYKNIPFYRHIGDISGNKTFSLPMPMFNVINGGKHANESTDFQEFMIVPAGARNFNEAIEMGSSVFHNLKVLLEKNNLSVLVGDEGGFAPGLNNAPEVLELLVAAIEKSGYKAGSDIALAIDAAASELYADNLYSFKKEGMTRNTNELLNYYVKLINDYPIISIEDGLSEDSWDDWQEFTKLLGNKIQIVGDDLLVTNSLLLKKAIKSCAANAILIKPNQVGTLSETIDAVNIAKQSGWKTIISHRSGETEDTSIAHIAVGLNAGQIKTGSLSRTDRVSKYNELFRIAESNPNIKFAKLSS